MPITDGKMSVRNQTVSTQSKPNHRTIRFHLKKRWLSLMRVWGPWRQTWTVVGEQEAPVHHDHDPLLTRRNQRLCLEQTHSTAPSRSQVPCHSRFQAGLDRRTPRTDSWDAAWDTSTSHRSIMPSIQQRNHQSHTHRQLSRLPLSVYLVWKLIKACKS